jgi:hypothetical protein
MENLDFNGTSGLVQSIEIPPSSSSLVIEEKKIEEPQMMEFSSSVADLMPTSSSQAMMGPPQDMYTNPTNGRVAGISLGGDSQPQQKKNQNPFNLTDEQFNALLAGIIAVVIYSSTVQGKLSGIVPNFGGINGSIASVLAAAILYYFAHRFIKNR